MPPYEQKFSFTTASEAAGVPHETVKGWVRRGYLVMSDNDREMMGRGGARQLSYHTTVQLIVMAEMTRYGVSLQDAADAALDFAHFGSETRNGSESRNPGDLFAKGLTILSFDAGAVRGPKSEIVNVTNGEAFINVFRKAQLRGPGPFRSSLFIDIGGLLLIAARPLGMADDWIRATMV